MFCFKLAGVGILLFISIMLIQGLGMWLALWFRNKNFKILSFIFFALFTLGEIMARLIWIVISFLIIAGIIEFFY
ncbi:hypothetical protein C0L75_03030 [Clostridium perfringens]